GDAGVGRVGGVDAQIGERAARAADIDAGHRQVVALGSANVERNLAQGNVVGRRAGQVQRLTQRDLLAGAGVDAVELDIGERRCRRVCRRDDGEVPGPRRHVVRGVLDEYTAGLRAGDAGVGRVGGVDAQIGERAARAADI